MKSRPTDLDRRSAGGAGRREGYTLLELLVATTILVILGAGLVTLLKEGIEVWHTAEKRAGIYDRARRVLDQVAEDLRAAAGDSRAGGAGFWLRFLCDQDPQGRQRLRFVRAISGEPQDPVAREGGKYLEVKPGAHYDLHGDAAEAQEGRLLAPAGYQEVLYALDPDPGENVLWRGMRSPIGGGGSLFIDRNLGEEEEVSGTRSAFPPRSPRGDGGRSPRRDGARSPRGDGAAESDGAKAENTPAGAAVAEGGSLRSRSKASKSTRAGREGSEAPPESEEPAGLPRAARPFAREVSHLSFAFWTPVTDTWDRRHPARLKAAGSERSGPILTWDSTRAILDDKAPPAEFAFRRVEGSLEDPSDDLFPERVEVTLVIQGNADVPLIVLAGEVGASDREIPVTRIDGLPEEGPDRFVKIEGEWIAYERLEAGKLILPVSKTAPGRGVRGTAPAAHPLGAVVDPGTTFRRVVELPAVRRAAPAPESGRRSR